MVGYMFCIQGGISSLGVDLVTLEQWLANLSTGQIQNVESYTRFTELKLLRDRSQESVFFKSPNSLDAQWIAVWESLLSKAIQIVSTKDLFGMGREKAQLKFEKKLRTAVLFTNYFGQLHHTGQQCLLCGQTQSFCLGFGFGALLSL